MHYSNGSRSGILELINSPDDVKELTAAESTRLCDQIRGSLIDSVARTGGHLGPNLGVVELSVALHRVFDSPGEPIVWDTGHQAYVHKMLTGRRDFSSLRQPGGLSGYPSRVESAHDVLENSHASTSLAWADGISMQRQRQGDTRPVVAVIGDGALTGGMAWEALNNIADDQNRSLVLVVNDNGRSYEPTIGGVARHLSGLRTSEDYERALAWGKRRLHSMGEPGRATYEALRGLKAGLRELIMPHDLFADIGLKYLGPVDGHDLISLEFALGRAKRFGHPVIVHVITEKGRGYTPAEQDVSDRFHAVGQIHPETGLPVAPQRFGWTAVFAEEILHLAEADDRIVGITAAMKAPVGLQPLADAFPGRVVDVGIAEQHGMAAAAGMAFAGARPVFALYATFLNRAFDQLLLDAALHRAPVTVMLDRAGITGDDGPSHNGMWDISLGAMVPGLQLGAPRDGQTLRRMLQESVAEPTGPHLVRYPKGELPPDLAAIDRVAGASLLHAAPDDAEGPRLALIGVGPLAAPAVHAAQQLAGPLPSAVDPSAAALAPGLLDDPQLSPGDVSPDQPSPDQLPGTAVDVFDPEWLFPIAPAFLEVLQRYDGVVIVEDGLEVGGYGSEIARLLAPTGTPVFTRGIPRAFQPQGIRSQILANLGLDSVGISALLAEAAARCGVKDKLLALT